MSTPPELRFQDPLPLGRAAAGLLAFGALFDGVWLIRLMAGMSHPEIAIQVPAALLHFWVRVATAVVFLVWLDRVYGNLPALGAVPEHPRVWSTLAFFVPPLFFFRPYQIVEESWRSSGRDDASPFARLVLAWWVAFLIPLGVLLTSIRLRDNPLQPDEKWGRITLASAVNVVAGVLAVVIVLRITERQRDTISRMRREAAAEALRIRREGQVPPPGVAGAPTLVPQGATVRAERPVPPPVPLFTPAAAPPPSAATVRRHSSPDIAAAAGVKRPRPATSGGLRIDALPPRAAQFALAALAALVAVALAAVAVVLAMRGTYGPAAMNGALALLTGAATWIAAKQPVAPGDAQRWVVLAAAGLLVAIINVVELAEVIIG